VAGSAALREVLINRARSLVFSTALPAAVCAAAEVALEKARSAALRARLGARVEQLAHGLGLRADSAVFSVVLGDATLALEASARLRAAGVLVKAIRPPTVPDGTSRLRISVSAAHSADDVDALVRLLAQASSVRAVATPREALRP